MCPSKADEFDKKLISTISEVLDFSDVVLNFLELNSSFKRGEIWRTLTPSRKVSGKYSGIAGPSSRI